MEIETLSQDRSLLDGTSTLVESILVNENINNFF